MSGIVKVGAFATAGVATGLVAAAGDHESDKPGNGSNAIVGLAAAGTTVGLVGIMLAGAHTRSLAGGITGVGAAAGAALLATRGSSDRSSVVTEHLENYAKNGPPTDCRFDVITEHIDDRAQNGPRVDGRSDAILEGIESWAQDHPRQWQKIIDMQ